MVRSEGGERGQVEGMSLRVEPQHGNEQQSGGDEGVEEILDSGATAFLGTAEGCDEKGHRHQRQLPEGVVEEHVEGGEDAHHGDLLEQEEDVEELLAAVDGAPGDEHSERREQAGEHHEPHREAVDADVVMDERRRNPGDVLLELERAGLGGVRVMERQVKREQERDEGDRERAPLHDLAAVGQKHEQQRAGQREEDDEGQDGVIDIHRVLTGTPAASGQRS
jgi:hypothetical protein